MRMTLTAWLALILAAGAASAQKPPDSDEDLIAVDPQTTTTVDLVGSLDLDRASADPAAAREMLPVFESLAAQASPGSPERGRIDAIRAFLLVASGRRDDGAALLAEVIGRGFSDPSVYELAWLAAVQLRDPERLVAVLEAASRNVPPAGRPQLYAGLPPTAVGPLVDMLEAEGNQALLARLYGAVVPIDWPGDANRELRDTLRLRLIDRQLRDGDRGAAAALARRIDNPFAVLRLAALKRYDGLLAGEEDRIALVRRALEAEDRASAGALAGQPEHAETILIRVKYLFSVGQAGAALSLLQPYLGDVSATANSDPAAHWLIDHAAYAMLMAGRGAEGAALYRRLAALPIETRDNLLDIQVNYINYLWRAGRYSEALAQAERVTREFDSRMNDYGRLWTWSGRVCALAGLGRSGEAPPWLKRMERLADANPNALMLAYLCLGDMAAAEAYLLERLISDDPTEAVMALQDWQILEAPGQPTEGVEQRLRELRARPAIAAALDRVGRSFSLPLARSYLGAY